MINNKTCKKSTWLLNLRLFVGKTLVKIRSCIYKALMFMCNRVYSVSNLFSFRDKTLQSHERIPVLNCTRCPSRNTHLWFCMIPLTQRGTNAYHFWFKTYRRESPNWFQRKAIELLHRTSRGGTDQSRVHKGLPE